MVGRLIWNGRLALLGSYLRGLPHTHFVITNIYTMLLRQEDLWWRAKQLEDAGVAG